MTTGRTTNDRPFPGHLPALALPLEGPEEVKKVSTGAKEVHELCPVCGAFRIYDPMMAAFYIFFCNTCWSRLDFTDRYRPRVILRNRYERGVSHG